MKRQLVGVFLTLLTLSCGREPTAPIGGETVLTLTAAQAATLVSRAQVISTSSSDLTWLADSIGVVLRGGAQALRVSVTVDSVPKTYYAVGLIRQITTASPFTTFHFIAFDDASNPTHFVLTNAYAPAEDGSAPNSTLGAFGTSTAFAHLISVSGATVTDWVAQSGSAIWQRVQVGGTCPGTNDTATVSCVVATMMMQASITLASSANNFGDTHTATTGVMVVPAVLLTFH